MAAAAPLTPMYAATLLGVTPVFLQTELSRVPVAALNWHPAAGEWCAKEVVGHLRACEKISSHVEFTLGRRV